MTHVRVAALWLVFVVVHAILITENLMAPNGPLGDVQVTYPVWWNVALTSGEFPGLTASGVYPFLALIPIGVAAQGFGAWFVLVVIIDAVAIAVLARRNETAAFAWLAFQLALGPIALGRIDTVTVALAVMAVALFAQSPRVAGILVAVATWVKVWPVAVGIAAMRSSRFGVFAKWSIGSALALTVAGMTMGDRASVFSFLTQQQGRGLQVESVAATPWLWDAWGTGQSTVVYSPTIHTFEIVGPGTEQVAAALTVVQVLVLAAVVLILATHRRSATSANNLSWALALLIVVSVLITTNKVGSPQFVSWLAVPLIAIVMSKLTRSTAFLVVTIGLIAVLTHIVYPYVYFAFLELRTIPLVVLTIRNGVEIALLVASVVILARQLRVEKLAQQFADLGIGDQKGVVTER